MAADVLIAGGELIEAPRGTRRLDAGGCFVTPGLVDLHTHLRQPGMEEAETVETGARAAALGGYTAVVAMPNTDPPIDSAGGPAGSWGSASAPPARSTRPGPSRWAGGASSWHRWPSWPPSVCACSPTTAPACRTPG